MYPPYARPSWIVYVHFLLLLLCFSSPSNRFATHLLLVGTIMYGHQPPLSNLREKLNFFHDTQRQCITHAYIAYSNRNKETPKLFVPQQLSGFSLMITECMQKGWLGGGSKVVEATTTTKKKRSEMVKNKEGGRGDFHFEFYPYQTFFFPKKEKQEFFSLSFCPCIVLSLYIL